ncbi:citrate synthase [Herbaspirillum sp. Sphag1AN]|uniref:citrate synthase family protein n=1 Tax=unclassified Herbaspirillum TaxID=2624150 RepID=UPI00160DC560|nr:MULTISPECIES: citrate synthase family protein [unclassified Herbaspirillum]MBB3213292.1 citrate synthase [Herbaspirillum sp. Sphag1AN]MBB3246664.1 citrate synthase [Herbaspirillum sp. Sphag64]
MPAKPPFLSANEAAGVLGVSRQTLYAYVSRGLLRAQPVASDGSHSRESRYLASDVKRLASQRTRGRKPREVAKATLSWGLPVLESAITLIEDGKLYYRGHDAVVLAQTMSVEALSAHLWNCTEESAFSASTIHAHPAFASVLPHFVGQRAEQAMLPLFTIASDDAATAAWQTSPQRQAEGCGTLMRLLAASLLGVEPSTAPIHQQCATVWQLDQHGAELVRIALILCADHELNASSFTARCVASTGTSLRAAIIAGLAALTGGKHGGTTARVEALLDEIIGDAEQDPTQIAHIRDRLEQRLARGESLPGFGHPLYPQGDIRAQALLTSLLPHHPAWQECITVVFALTGQLPSLDFALAALRRHLQLPLGAAYGLFALGRGMGWIAQALEQRTNGELIRPRANYIGVRPAS